MPEVEKPEAEAEATTLASVVEMIAKMQQQYMNVQYEQNKKNNEILEKLASKENVVREDSKSPLTNGPSIDAMEARIVNFDYDAEECTFENWYEQYRDFFEYDAKHLDDGNKVRILLRQLSVKCNALYRDHKAPEDVMKKSFEDTVKALKALFGKKETDFELRIRFFKLSMAMNGSTDVMEFASEVNRLYQKGNLKDAKEDQMKITIFLAGLDLPNQKTIRTQLLHTVNQKPDITYKELLERYSSLRALEREVSAVQTNVANMVRVPEDDNGKNRKKPKTERSKSNVKCTHCGKNGHTDERCWLKHPEMRPKKNFRNNSVQVKVCNLIEGNRVYVNVSMDGKQMECQLDTGSDLTLISEVDWKEMKNPKLIPAPCTVSCANGQGMKIIGKFRSTMEYCGKKCDAWIHVTPRPIRLVGNDVFFKLDLKRAFSDENDETVIAHIKSGDYTTWVKDVFPEVCEPGLGKYNKSAAKLYLKPGVKPVFRNKRPVPYASQQVCDEEINRLCDMGVISKVEHSEWAAPFLLVAKKNGAKRLCADFKTGLNDCLEDCTHPLKLPEDIFASLNGGTVFSTIDFSDAYLQVEVDEEAKKLLVINTHRGLYQYHRLPLYVKPARGIFQSIMDQMLTGMSRTVAYLDDVIVSGRTKEEHDENLMRVLERIRDSGFRIRLEKCAFGQKEVHFLRFIVNESGRHPDPKKVHVLKEMQVSKDETQPKSFLGGVNYYGTFDQNIEYEGCESAAKNPSKAESIKWPEASRPMERVHMDFAGPMNGRYYLIIVDVYSTWPEVITMERITADATIKALRDFVSRYGSPETIVSDNGTQFKSEKIRSFCMEYGINHMFSPPYHPQSNGHAERFVDTFKRSLLKMRGEGPENENVQKFLMMYRCTPNNQLKMCTPAEIFLGRKMRCRLTLMSPREGEERVLNEKVTREFAEGDTVYYRDRNGPNHEKWTEAVVLRRKGNVIYEIQRLDGSHVTAHANQLRRRWIEDCDPLSVLLESFNVPADNVVESNVQVEPAKCNVTPSAAAAVVTDADADAVVVPTNNVENNKKKTNPKATVVRPGSTRPSRSRQPPSRLNISSTSGQTYY